MPLARDLLHPSLEDEKKKHKKKRLVQSPNSYFMDVKCSGCYNITTVFSHAQTVVICVGCSPVLCQPTGEKARLTEGCSFRRKQHYSSIQIPEFAFFTESLIKFSDSTKTM
ncbi:40S ribosomal protein S27-like [Microtus oregoni]|uniref:40S ribosomal protein S27-like n=1 Tax=Microtus oregoni TaxID=111838 RepID=UPI001BB1496C|nr:40S ribosomal protein S27-like [Microtus oregoni]